MPIGYIHLGRKLNLRGSRLAKFVLSARLIENQSTQRHAVTGFFRKKKPKELCSRAIHPPFKKIKQTTTS